LEHDPHDVKPESWQWIGQAPSLHALRVERVGHATPPCRGFNTISRSRILEPTPQVLEQVPHTDQADMMQSTGQFLMLQVAVDVAFGQAAPPKAAVWVTDLDRDLDPRPHDFVHFDQEDQEVMAQFTGHECTLQDWRPTKRGQSLPP
jgi:hypothetical protein